MCKYELPIRQGFRKLYRLTVYSTYIQTNRQTGRQTGSKLYTTPLRGWSEITPMHARTHKTDNLITTYQLSTYIKAE